MELFDEEQNSGGEENEDSEKVRKDILNSVFSGNVEKTRDKVAYILNHFSETRNSDIELAWQYWTFFESNKFNGACITKEQMYGLTGINSLIRFRAKIQNEYKLFQADDTVKKYRGTLKDEHRVAAVESKPSGIGSYSVYVDETGKTQEFLSVGSLWVLESNQEMHKAAKEMLKWKSDNEIDYEFHFTDVNTHRIEKYKEFFGKFISLYPAIGFKLIVVRNRGFSDKNIAITDLTYHLLCKGILHEHESRRAVLPRLLQVSIDEEEPGSDKLKIENIRERISGQRIEGLYVDTIECLSSRHNSFLQITDLFTGAINRKLHFPDGSHFKDDFANFVLNILRFDPNEINTENNLIDNSTLFNLT